MFDFPAAFVAAAYNVVVYIKKSLKSGETGPFILRKSKLEGFDLLFTNKITGIFQILIYSVISNSEMGTYTKVIDENLC